MCKLHLYSGGNIGNTYYNHFSEDGKDAARLFVSDLDKYQLSHSHVAFLGLYDTVLQSPYKYSMTTSIFHMDVNYNESSELPKIVDKAVHFAAIDKHRYNFQPTLLNKDPRVKEIWVPGCHSDCAVLGDIVMMVS